MATAVRERAASPITRKKSISDSMRGLFRSKSQSSLDGSRYKDKSSKVQSFNQGAGRGAAVALQFGRVATPKVAAAAALAVAAEEGFPRAKLLFASSTCPDEVNCAAEWEPLFSNGIVPAFRLGGLAGIYCAGVTGFKAYASHAPDGGALFIFYGPHCGLSDDGARVGKLRRAGQAKESGACGACLGALAWARSEENVRCGFCPSSDDYQLDLVKASVLKHLPALDEAEGRDELAVYCDLLCDDIRKDILAAIAAAKPGLPCYLLGGVQINGSFKSNPELLAIRHFELRTASGDVVDKMDALKEGL